VHILLFCCLLLPMSTPAQDGGDVCGMFQVTANAAHCIQSLVSLKRALEASFDVIALSDVARTIQHLCLHSMKVYLRSNLSRLHGMNNVCCNTVHKYHKEQKQTLKNPRPHSQEHKLSIQIVAAAWPTALRATTLTTSRIH